MSATIEMERETDALFPENPPEEIQTTEPETEEIQATEPETEEETAPRPDSDELCRLQTEAEYHRLWQKKIDKLVKQIDGAKSHRTHYNGICKEYETELRDLLLKGPETMHGRPLLDAIEKKEADTDPELWRQTPIAELQIPLKWSKAAAEHFQNAGQLVDWLNTHPRDKRKGLGKKAIESLESAVNLLHEPVIQEQLKEVLDGETESETEELEHLFGEIPEDADDGDWTWMEEEEWVDENEDEEAVEADEESD